MQRPYRTISYKKAGVLMWAVGLSLTVLSGAARAQMAFAPEADPVVKTPVKAAGYTISGSVTDAVDGSPIPGVYVTAGKYGAQTDAQGRFLIKDVPAGRYTVRTMYYSAYTSDQAEIDLKADAAGLSLKIKEQALALGEVVVTGTRTERHLADVPVLTTVIPSREIEKSAATSVLSALEDVVPGIVSSDNAMGNNLRIKGLNSRYILFLVDGERLVSEGAGGNVNLDQIDVNQIERIEVVQGAASALYGSNAVGAIINIITKAPVHKIEAGAKATWETPNELRVQADVGSRFKDVTLRANAFRNASAGFDVDGGTYAAPYTDYGAQLKTEYKPGEQWRLNLDGRYYRHEVFNPENSLNTTHGLDQKMSLGAGGEWRPLSGKHILRLSANWDKYFDDDVLERKQNAKSRQNVNDYLSARLLHTFHINTKWELVSGLEYNHESNYAIKTLGTTPTRKSVDDFNAFTQATYKVVKDLELEAGARYTYNTQFGSAFTPKFSLMYEVVGLKFRAGVGTSFRAPSIKELYYDFDHQGMFWVYGNPDLKAEHGLYASFSVEYTYGPFNVSASTYYNRINQKITQYEVFENGRNDRYYRNVSSASLEGFDFQFTYVLLRQLVFKGSYSFCDAVDNSTGLQLEDNVRHSGTASITWNGKILKSPFSLQMAGRFHSPKLYQEMITDAETGEQTVTYDQSKPYAIFKVVLVKPFRIKTHTIEVTFKCDNLFNFKDASFVNPGRTYLVGLRYAFK